MGSSQVKLFFPLMVCGSMLIGACGSDDDGGSPPVMDPLSDQVAYVDSEFTMEIVANDPDGDPLKFGFKSTITDIGTRAELRTAGNKAVFRWTVIAADIGSPSFDFTVSDGKNTAKETITIVVKQSATASNAPIFRKPLGTGTTLDLTQKKCIDVDVVVEDSDSPGVTISQEAPVITDASLDQSDGLSATWSWCPSKAQIDESDRHVLKLAADDGDNPATTKNYLIVLRKPQKENCPGTAPVIEHTAQSAVSTKDDVSIDVHVTDDSGIKYEPLVYYTSKPPSDPPDLAQMNQVTMTTVDGDMKDGNWTAKLPNPVASQAGATASLFYLIVAQDDDDKAGDCDHLAQSPATGAYEVKVTNPEGGGPTSCTDDTWEDNDTRAQANAKPVLTAGEHADLKSCPSAVSADEDWYRIDISQSGTIFAMLDGGDSSDLDLSLIDDSGTILATSDGLDSLEFVDKCLTPGVYFLQVYTWQNTENSYTLSYDFSAESCGQSTCDDDGNEQDDNAGQARVVDLNNSPYKSDTNAICSMDEDWYHVLMFAGETLYATITFDQTTAMEDLDIILYQGATNLTPCDETVMTGCDVQNGQSGTSNETLTWPITTQGDYYVVVRGFDRSENLYDICIGLDATECPAP